MGLFNLSDFTLSSGRTSRFKIDCDHLSDEDVEALADRAAELAGGFAFAIGVPTGGERLAQALNRRHRLNGATTLLLVDDVLTTGGSMERMKALFAPHVRIKGLVLFARGRCPEWITPLFQMAAEERPV